MDHIQTQLSVSVINNYYVTDEFGLGFLPAANASWANEGFTYPNEHHGTYFLRLAGALPFGGTGQLDEELRPLVFTCSVVYADPHKTPRHLLVQPVPRDFCTLLLRPPVAVWRGIGSEVREGGGGPAAALSLVSLYVQQIAEDRRHQDPNHDWQYHSFLSIQQVTVKPPPPSNPRFRSRAVGDATATAIALGTGVARAHLTHRHRPTRDRYRFNILNFSSLQSARPPPATLITVLQD